MSIVTPLPCVNVALCADRAILPGLHVTLHSALSQLAPTHGLNITLLHDQLSADDIGLLHRTLASTKRTYSLQPIEFSPAAFSGFRSLGGWMTYARIVVPQFVAADRVIYLDSDLIVYADLTKLFDETLEGRAVGAVSWFPVSESNDADLLAKAGLRPEAPYFNAGVLLLDTAAWTAADLTARCVAVGEQYGRRLPSADQTILNILLSEDGYKQVPRRFNTPVTASRCALSPDDVHQRVVHLQGRPKPWDPFGRRVHGQGEHFFAQFEATAYYKTWHESGSLAKEYRIVTRNIRAYAKAIHRRTDR